MKSWDRFEIPLPFAPAMFLYGDPFTVERDIPPDEREFWRMELERRLNELSEQGERDFDELYHSAS